MSALKKRQERAALIVQAREVVQRAETEKRALTSEEDARYNQIMADVDSLRVAIDREERLAALEAEMATSQGTQAAGRGNDPDPENKEVRAAFQKYLKTGVVAPELRTLQVTQDIMGGFLVPPEHFVRQLIKAVDDMVFIRRLGTVMQLTRAESLGAPSLDTDLVDSDWTTELATGTLDDSLRLGKRVFQPIPFAKRIRVSNTLLRLAPDVEALVTERLAYRFAVTEERGYLTGDGTNRPLGLFTASAQGIPTGRDQVVGTPTDITFDGLTNAKYALKFQYHGRAAWLLSRLAVNRIALLKDSTNNYLWRESTRAGEPDSLMGFPIYMSEFVPAVFTTGLYVGMLADFRHYWIAESLNFQLQRLVELYAESNEVGFIGRKEADGMPVLAEAFVRLRLA